MTLLNQHDHPVHCCVCLNLHGRHTVATSITGQGYLLCDEHQPCDIETLTAAVWRTGGPT